MIKGTDTQKTDDANIFGETLREYCFIDGYGCYESFKLLSEFKKVDKETKLGQRLLRYLNGDHNSKLGTVYIWPDILEFAELFSNGIIHIAWYWDGDGTLVFVEENRVAENTDCKDANYWKWIKE